jgi:cell division ATPase FtsA
MIVPTMAQPELYKELGEGMDRISDDISHDNFATFSRAERRKIMCGQKP